MVLFFFLQDQWTRKTISTHTFDNVSMEKAKSLELIFSKEIETIFKVTSKFIIDEYEFCFTLFSEIYVVVVNDLSNEGNLCRTHAKVNNLIELIKGVLLRIYKKEENIYLEQIMKKYYGNLFLSLENLKSFVTNHDITLDSNSDISSKNIDFRALPNLKFDNLVVTSKNFSDFEKKWKKLQLDGNENLYGSFKKRNFATLTLKRRKQPKGKTGRRSFLFTETQFNEQFATPGRKKDLKIEFFDKDCILFEDFKNVSIALPNEPKKEEEEKKLCYSKFSKKMFFKEKEIISEPKNKENTKKEEEEENNIEELKINSKIQNLGRSFTVMKFENDSDDSEDEDEEENEIKELENSLQFGSQIKSKIQEVDKSRNGAKGILDFSSVQNFPIKISIQEEISAIYDGDVQRRYKLVGKVFASLDFSKVTPLNFNENKICKFDLNMENIAKIGNFVINPKINHSESSTEDSQKNISFSLPGKVLKNTKEILLLKYYLHEGKKPMPIKLVPKIMNKDKLCKFMINYKCHPLFKKTLDLSISFFPFDNVIEKERHKPLEFGNWNKDDNCIDFVVPKGHDLLMNNAELSLLVQAISTDTIIIPSKGLCKVKFSSEGFVFSSMKISNSEKFLGGVKYSLISENFRINLISK